MQRLVRQHMQYNFRSDVQSMLRVALDEPFLVETDDFITNHVKDETDVLTEETTRPFSEFTPNKWNPVTGPIYVEGVNRGDVLVLEFEQISPHPRGVCCIVPGFGPLANSLRWPVDGYK